MWKFDIQEPSKQVYELAPEDIVRDNCQLH